MGKHLVVSSIGSRDVACAEWPDIRRIEHFLYLLNLVDDAFNIHESQSSKRRRGAVNRKLHQNGPECGDGRDEAAC